ncbi:nascent polypeptide-associated complex subunit alpha, muscle-specific form-like [Haliotis asinina]|uniref:nascent polypeptide-associated complex subunit alpha, muscle-specific form-like n=1 Tax=Haliotis asinina TaxID=109174 RepID=UPI0035325E69
MNKQLSSIDAEVKAEGNITFVIPKYNDHVVMNKQHSFNVDIKAEENIAFLNSGSVDPTASVKSPNPKVGSMQQSFVPVIMPNQTLTRVSQGSESMGQGPMRLLTSPGSSVSPVIMSSLPVLQNSGTPLHVISSTKFMAGSSTGSVIGQTLPVMQCVSTSTLPASNAVQLIQNQPTQNIQIMQSQSSASASVLQNSLGSNIQIVPQNAIQVMAAPSQATNKTTLPSNPQIMHQPSLQNQSLNAVQVMTALSEAVKKNKPPSNPQIMHQTSLQNVSQNAIQVVSAPSEGALPSSNPKITQQPSLQIIQTPSGQLQLVPVEQATPTNMSNTVSILKPHQAGVKKKTVIKKEITPNDKSAGRNKKSPSAANPILNNLLKKVRSRIEHKKSSSVTKDESSKVQSKQLPNILPKGRLEKPLKEQQEMHKKQPEKNETEINTSEVKDADKDDDKPVVIIKDQHRENVEDKITFAGTSVKPKFAIEFSPNNLQAYVQAVANAVENHKTLSEQNKLELKTKRKKVGHRCAEEDCFWMAEVPKETAPAPKASRRKQTLAVRKDPFDGCEIVVEPFRRQPKKQKKVPQHAESPVPEIEGKSSQTDDRESEDEVDVENIHVPDPKAKQKEKSPPREVRVFIPPTMTKSISSNASFQPQYLVKDTGSISSPSSNSSTRASVSGEGSSSQKSEDSFLPVPLNKIKTEPLEKKVAPSNSRPTHLKNVSSNDKTKKNGSVKQTTRETLCHTSADTDASKDPCPVPVASIKVETLSPGYEPSSCRKVVKKSLNFGSTEVARLTEISKMPSPLPKPMSPSKVTPKENVPLSSPGQTSDEKTVGQETTPNPSSVNPNSLHANSVLPPLLHPTSVPTMSLYPNSVPTMSFHPNSVPTTSLHPNSVQQQHSDVINQTMVKRVTQLQNAFNYVVKVNTKLPEDTAIRENQQFPLQPSEQNSLEKNSAKQSTELVSQDNVTTVHHALVDHVTASPKVFSSVTGTHTKLPEGTASEKNIISTANTLQLATNTTISQENSQQTLLRNQKILNSFLTLTGQEDLSLTAKSNVLPQSAPVHVVQPRLRPKQLLTVNSNVTVPVTPLFSSNFMQVPSVPGAPLNIVNPINQQKKVYVVPSSLYSALVAQANSGKPVKLTSADLMASLEQNSTETITSLEQNFTETMAAPKTQIDTSSVMLIKKQDENKIPLVPVPVTELLRSNNMDVCEEMDKGFMELKIASVFSLNKVCCKLTDKVPSYLDMCLNSKLEHSLKLCFVVLDDKLPPLFRGKAGTKRTRFKMPKVCPETCRTQALDLMCAKNKWRNIKLGDDNYQTFSEPVAKRAKRK